MAQLAIYRVIQLDVWGNEKEGFEVNDLYRTNRVYEIDFEDDEQILEQLTVAGELIGFTIDNTEIEGDENTLYLSHAETCRPIMQLEFVEHI